MHHNDPKFSDRQVRANSADQDLSAPDQVLNCLLFHLHRLDVSHLVRIFECLR